MIDERFARFAGASDDVDHSIRQSRFLQNLREMHRGDAGGFRGLEDAGVSAREGRRKFPRRHQERKIPWNDLTGDTERARGAARKCVSEFVRPSGVIKKV